MTEFSGCQSSLGVEDDSPWGFIRNFISEEQKYQEVYFEAYDAKFNLRGCLSSLASLAS